MTAHTRRVTSRTPVQQAALLVGVVFLMVGILGFIPGITTNYSAMEFATHESDAKLFGIFQISILHNLVHLAFGVAGLALARTASAAYNYLLVGGVIYLVLWIYGLVVSQESAANFVPLNTADDWLHFGLGIAMVGLALLLGRRTPGTENR